MSYPFEFFNQIAGNSVLRAKENINNSISYMVTPYYDLSSNLKALWHPLYHAFQFILNIIRFGVSAFVAIGLLVRGESGAWRATHHSALFAAAAVLEIVDTALSIISLVVRFVASVLNLGYVSTRVQLLDALGIEAYQPISALEGDDLAVHQSAFRII